MSSDTLSFIDVGTEYEETLEDPIIVLVVGETQHGKSTLIRQIGRYAGATDLDIKIGRGSKSCTTAVGQHAFSIPLQRYQLVDIDQKPITEQKFTDLCKLTTRQAMAKAEAPEGGRSTLFEFIDTPGLDDSDENDLDIMAGIISRLTELRHLNGIIYVRSIDTPFSNSFSKFFSYIQQSLQSISAGIVIAHTRYTTEETAKHLKDNASLQKLRREAFKKATHLDACHFFMDNLPDPDEPFAVVQSMNEIYRLLLFMRSQKAINTADLKLLKTKRMEYVDAHVVAALGTVRSKLESRWNAEVAAEKGARQELFRKVREISNKRTLHETHKAEIQAIRSEDSILLGSKAIDEDYTLGDFFTMNYSIKPYEYQFTGHHAIDEVRKTVGKGCKWQNEQQQGANWKGTLKANKLTSLVGSVTFYTTGVLKHQDKLNYLEKECARLEGQLELLGQGFEEGEPSLEESNPVIAQLKNLLEECNSLIQDIDKKTFPMSFYHRLKHIYLLDWKPSRDDIFLFIQTYNRQLADVYWKEQVS